MDATGLAHDEDARVPARGKRVPCNERGARATRGRALLVFGIFAAAALSPMACILADPPALLPPVAQRRPSIVHSGVVPPTTRILRAWPQELLVPVDVDSAEILEWRAFIDYEPRSRGPVAALGALSPDPTNDDAGVRILPIALQAPDPNDCHTIEIIVALNFEENHTPGAPGGDTVTWFYSPTGDLRGCPVVELDAAALDGSFPPDGADE